MIIFLYGEDTYRSRKKLDEIITQYKKAHKSGLNLIYMNAEEKDFSDLNNCFKSVSMFAETKLVILKNLFFDKNFSEKFFEHLKDLEKAKDVIVIYENEKIDERSKLFKALKKFVKSQEFNFLTPAKLGLWIDAELARYNAKIEPLAKNIFISCVGNDLWKAENEIKKLAFYRPGKTINPDCVRAHVKPKIDNDIFKTIDAIAQKDKNGAMDLLHKHMDAGDNGLYLLSMIAYQFKNLMLIKDNPQKSGLHPFVIKKNYALAAQFSMEELKKIYHHIFEIDFNIKMGKIDPDLAIDLFISSL